MSVKNEGQLDRAIRLIAGIVLLIIGYQLSGWAEIVLFLLAIVLMITAATGTCWIYKAFSINTNEHPSDGEAKPETTVAPQPQTMPEVMPEEPKIEEPMPEPTPIAEEPVTPVEPATEIPAPEPAPETSKESL